MASEHDPESRMQDLMEKLGHSFGDAGLLSEALRHSSDPDVNQGRAASNQRLEFLGDRVLGLVIAHMLHDGFPGEDEGAQAKRLAALVQRQALALVGTELGIGDLIEMARGEEDTGGRANPAILADAMEAHPVVFTKMYINIVRAGEEGGILHELLPDLADYMETSARTRQAVIAAMIYPIVLLVTGVVSVALLLIFVIPQFAAMFEDAGTEIPPSAAFLLSLSAFIQSYGIIFIILIACMVVLWRRMDKEPGSRLQKHGFLLSLPMVGTLIIYKDCAVFARTLGALLGAGIPLIRALRVAREVISNAVLSQHLHQVEEDVRGGAGLGISLKKTGQFPTLLHQLIAVGEESGRTSKILLKLAVTFDNHVRNQMSALVSALQPALILFLAIAVGGITITMLSAVFSMNAVEF